MRPARQLFALPFAVLAVLAGCGGYGDDDDESSEPTATTPESVKLAVYERSLSECGTQSVTNLARTYNVRPRQSAVATAVAVRWVDRLNGERDAVR